jgi:hypothetical protein
MQAKVIPFTCAPSAEFHLSRIRELATDSRNLVFDHPHFQERLLARGLSMRHALETLREGSIVGSPRRDEWGDWRIKLSRLVSGRRVQIVVAYKGDHLVAVTII